MRADLRLADLGTERSPSKLMNVKVPAATADAIDAMAADLGCSKTAVVIALMNEGLDAFAEPRGAHRAGEGTMADRLYPPVDPIAVGEHYTRHVQAMTAEGLHSKGDIAAQLAWRDQQIAERDAELARLRGEVAAIEDAFASVNDWYQPEEEHERPLADRVRDAVADLELDRGSTFELADITADRDRLAAQLAEARATLRTLNEAVGEGVCWADCEGEAHVDGCLQPMVQAALAAAPATLDVTANGIIRALLLSADAAWYEQRGGHDWCDAVDAARKHLGPLGPIPTPPAPDLAGPRIVHCAKCSVSIEPAPGGEEGGR